MSLKGTWFLPCKPGCRPDFTFTAEGPLLLGTVLESFNDPTAVLFSPAADQAAPPISFPEEQTIDETDHKHSETRKGSAGFKILANFLEVASASTTLERERENTLKFGKVDHKVQQYKTPFSQTAINAILEQPAVSKYRVPNFIYKLRPRAVYVVSGLRFAVKAFEVENNDKLDIHARSSIKASPTAVAAATTVPIGGKVSGHGGIDQKGEHSYKTSAGVVFAYRVHVIRRRAKLLSSSSAFMTGTGDSQELEWVEVTKDETDDLEPGSVVTVGEEEDVYCPWTPVRQE